MIHDIKVLPEFFDAVDSGMKRAEIRRDDRGYKVGDYLKMREFLPDKEEYTGRIIFAEITHKLVGWGLLPDYCCISVKKIFTTTGKDLGDAVIALEALQNALEAIYVYVDAEDFSSKEIFAIASNQTK